MIPLGFLGGGSKVFPLDTVNNKGLVWYLGSRNDTQAFVNPHTQGDVTCTWISTGSGSPQQGIDRITAQSIYTAAIGNDWWKIDIATNNLNRKLNASHMRFLHNPSFVNQYLVQSAEVQGSNDNSAWTTLCVITPGMISGTTWSTLTMTTFGDFRYFRFYMTSLNNNGYWYLMGVEYELFGTLTE